MGPVAVNVSFSSGQSSLPLIFSILSIMCLGVGFFVFILPGVYLILFSRFQFSLEIYLFGGDLKMFSENKQ